MSQSRMSTSWDDRLDAYLTYEIDLVGDQSEPLENSYEEFVIRATNDGQELVSTL